MYICNLFDIDNQKIYEFVKSRNDKNNYVYDTKYIFTTYSGPSF